MGWFLSALRWTGYFSVTALFSGLVLLYWFQNKIIYPSSVPEGSRKSVSKPSEFGMNKFTELWLETRDNLKLHAYYIPTQAGPSSNTTLLFLHANAGNMGHRLPIAKMMQAQLGCNLFMLSYRGYGLSEGQADEGGLKVDAQTALDHIVENYNSKSIIVFGQSIGGAVAIDLVAKNEVLVKALVLENTFLSLPRLIPSVMPAIRHFSFLCHQKWQSDVSILNIKSIPVLFLSGSKDQLVPQSHMKELYESVRSKRKQATSNLVFKEFKDGNHNDTCIQPGFFEAIREFVKKHVS